MYKTKILTKTYSEGENSENGPDRLPDLIHRTAVLAINVLQVLHKSINLCNSIAQHFSLLLEAADKSFDFIKCTFTFCAGLGFIDDRLEFFCSHDVEGSAGAGGDGGCARGSEALDRSEECSGDGKSAEQHCLEVDSIYKLRFDGVVFFVGLDLFYEHNLDRPGYSL